MIGRALLYLWKNRRAAFMLGGVLLEIYKKIFNKKQIKNNMQKLGIDTLKRDLTAFAELAGAVDQALADKKINPIEGVKIALKATPLIKVITTFKEAKAELLDLDGAEKAEIIEHFKTKFDIRNDEAEAAVESLIEMAINISDNLTLFGALKPINQ